MQDQVSTWNIRTSILTVAGTPVTAIQYAASSSNAAELLYFSISQSSQTTSAQERVSVFRKTAGATVTAGTIGGGSPTIFDLTGNTTGGASTFRGTLSTTGTGVNATAEGTPGDEPFGWNFNVLAGYEKDFQPQARIWVPISGIIAIRIKAVVAATYDVLATIREMK